MRKVNDSAIGPTRIDLEAAHLKRRVVSMTTGGLDRGLDQIGACSQTESVNMQLQCSIEWQWVGKRDMLGERAGFVDGYPIGAGNSDSKAYVPGPIFGFEIDSYPEPIFRP